MPKSETDLALRIRDKTLELLLEKEPEEITIRDIGKACAVTSASIYYYYKDKETLFTEVKLFCIGQMDEYLSAHTAKKITKYRISHERINLLEEIKFIFETFRDWAFEHPRIALLVMERFKADIIDDPDEIAKYYQSIFFGQSFLDRAVKAGILHSKDTMLDASLCVAALWGAIECVLLNRTHPQYWSQTAGINFTNNMIDFIMASLMSKNQH
jgi:AcrR family transcriptional regulator